MTDMTDQVRETFATVSQEVPVPPFDEVAFRARVRRARRRRTGVAVLGLGAAAAALTAALLVVPPLTGSDEPARVAGAPEDRALDPRALPAPLYYIADMRLMAATPDGEVHDLGRFEAVVGSTAEGVLALDLDSTPVWIGSTTSGEGDGSYTFERDGGPVELPETGPVQSLALSGDGRYLAWADPTGGVVVHDLVAQERVDSLLVGQNASVTSVSGRGVLVSQGGRLTLYGSPDVEVPTLADGYGYVSDTAGELVTVADRDDVTRVYDVTKLSPSGTATLVDSVPGSGRLAPYADGIVTVSYGEPGQSVAWLWTDGSSATRLAGVEGAPQSAGWFDEDHAVVTSTDQDGTTIHLCPVAEAACTPVVFSKDEVRLAE